MAHALDVSTILSDYRLLFFIFFFQLVRKVKRCQILLASPKQGLRVTSRVGVGTVEHFRAECRHSRVWLLVSVLPWYNKCDITGIAGKGSFCSAHVHC